MKPSLTLTFDAGWGETFRMRIDLDEYAAKEFMDIAPPLPTELGGDFATAVQIMKQREFRKDVFVGEATRLGRLLAERMEDAEGWHDIGRIDHARKELSR